jgi:hypothetical protein
MLMRKSFPSVSIFLVALCIWISSPSAFGVTVAEEFEQQIAHLQRKADRWSMAGGVSFLLSWAGAVNGNLPTGYGSLCVAGICTSKLGRIMDKRNDAEQVLRVLRLDGSSDPLCFSRHQIISDILIKLKKDRKLFRRVTRFTRRGEAKLLRAIPRRVRKLPRSFFIKNRLSQGMCQKSAKTYVSYDELIQKLVTLLPNFTIKDVTWVIPDAIPESSEDDE